MYNSFSMYDKKKTKEDSLIKKLLFSMLIKTLVVIVIFLGSLIFIRTSSNNKKIFKKYVYTNSLSFAKIYSIYNKYLGNVIPFKDVYKDNTKVVSSEKFTFNNVNKKDNSYVFDIASETVISSLKTGIIIEKKKDKNNKIIIKIQDKNGLNITYANLSEVSVDLYDYVTKGELIGKADKTVILTFEKDGKYLSYEKYL